MVGLGQAEAGADLTLLQPLGVAVVLGVGRELLEQDDEGVVADDRVLGLQVVVQAQPLGGEVLADDGHGEVGAALAAPFHRPGVAQVPSLVGAAAGLAQQGLPLVARQAAGLEVGAGVFAPVVEEADVVVLLLQRLDLGVDEPVELVEVVLDVLRNVEIHRVASLC